MGRWAEGWAGVLQVPGYQSEKGATSYVVRHLEPGEERQKPQRMGETQRAGDCEELPGLWAAEVEAGPE